MSDIWHELVRSVWEWTNPKIEQGCIVKTGIEIESRDERLRPAVTPDTIGVVGGGEIRGWVVNDLSLRCGQAESDETGERADPNVLTANHEHQPFRNQVSCKP